MQILISWLLQKPTDLDLHCLQRQDISGFSRNRVNTDRSQAVDLVLLVLCGDVRPLAQELFCVSFFFVVWVLCSICDHFVRDDGAGCFVLVFVTCAVHRSFYSSS